MLKYLFSFHSQFTSFSSQNGMTLQGKIWSTEIIQCSSGTGSVISSRRIFIILQNTPGRCFETKWFVLLYLPQEGHDKIFRTLNLPHQHFSSQFSTMESKEASRAWSGSIACLASDPFPGLPLFYPALQGVVLPHCSSQAPLPPASRYIGSTGRTGEIEGREREKQPGNLSAPCFSSISRQLQPWIEFQSSSVVTASSYCPSSLGLVAANIPNIKFHLMNNMT